MGKSVVVFVNGFTFFFREKHRASERVSKQANGRASGPVLQSVFLVVLDHSAVVKDKVSLTLNYTRLYNLVAFCIDT